MKLERVIDYDAKAMDSLSLILAVAKEYREADTAMKPALMKALQHFLNPQLMAREVPDAPVAAEAQEIVPGAMAGMNAPTALMPAIPSQFKRS